MTILELIILVEGLILAGICVSAILHYGLIPHIKRITWTFGDYWTLSVVIEFVSFVISIIVVGAIYNNADLIPNFSIAYFLTMILINIGVGYYGDKTKKWVV